MTLTEMGITAAPIKMLASLGLAFAVIGALLSITMFVIKAVGLYEMANKAGINNSWFGFVPCFNAFLLGEIAGKYRDKNGKRITKLGMTLSLTYILSAVLIIVTAIFAILGLVDVLFIADAAMAADAPFTSSDFAPLKTAGIFLAVTLAVMLVYKILTLVALSRIFSAFDYKNTVFYVILLAIFGFLTPIFILYTGKKWPAFSYVERMADENATFSFGD